MTLFHHTDLVQHSSVYNTGGAVCSRTPPSLLPLGRHKFMLEMWLKIVFNVLIDYLIVSISFFKSKPSRFSLNWRIIKTEVRVKHVDEPRQ